MANQARNERRQLKLTDALVDVQPVGIVYNLTKQVIEDFVYNYLANTKGIDKFEAVRADVRKTPQFGLVIDVFGFISPSSSHVISKSMRVESIIKEQMDSSSFKTSSELQAALSKVAKDTRLLRTGKGNPLAVRLDTYKILSLMLAVDPYKHELAITEVKQMKRGNFVATVVKQETYPKSEERGGDKYSDLVRRFK